MINSWPVGLLGQPLVRELGREQVKLQWQVAPLGTPFTATTVISGASATWTDVLTTGVVLTQNVSGLTPEAAYHWRARLVYRPGNRLGQTAGRWMHTPWNSWTETDFRTPFEAAVANFSASPTSGAMPLTVTFANNSTGASSYLWDFGDGFTSTLANPVHVYTATGYFSVTLTAFGATQDTLTRTNYIYVHDGLEKETVIRYTYGPLH